MIRLKTTSNVLGDVLGRVDLFKRRKNLFLKLRVTRNRCAASTNVALAALGLRIFNSRFASRGFAGFLRLLATCGFCAGGKNLLLPLLEPRLGTAGSVDFLEFRESPWVVLDDRFHNKLVQGTNLWVVGNDLALNRVDDVRKPRLPLSEGLSELTERLRFCRHFVRGQ